ncbi:MAG: DUF697 domain-containing protein [Eggerthellaceae bacterium]|nr:DUF697 domain-containing protein [Eggerthellaceae bacterium]
MALPVDIGGVLQITKDMQAVRDVPVSVAVLIDDTAPGELAAQVRTDYASTSAKTRVTVNYLDAGYAPGHERDDFAVIVAGDSPDVGRLAREIRDAGVPVMVVTDDAGATAAIAEEAGYPMPHADILSPVKLKGSIQEKVASYIPALRASVDDLTDEGPVALDEETLKLLSQRMGEWVITTCHEKRLTMALSFPFIRRPLANDAISATSLQNAAIGFVPVLPGADMPIMTLNQIKMVLQIATAYGQPIGKESVGELVAVLGGAFLARGIARAGAKLIPFAGWAISGAVGFAATEAMGRAAVEYFEAGGDIVGMAKVLQTARDGAVDAAAKAAASPVGKKVVSKVADSVPGFTKIVTPNKDA